MLSQSRNPWGSRKISTQNCQWPGRVTLETHQVWIGATLNKRSHCGLSLNIVCDLPSCPTLIYFVMSFTMRWDCGSCSEFTKAEACKPPCSSNWHTFAACYNLWIACNVDFQHVQVKDKRHTIVKKTHCLKSYNCMETCTMILNKCTL